MQERRTLKAVAVRRLHPAIAIAAALAVAVDQASKTWALNRLADGDIHLVGSMRLHLSRNTGISFSIGTGRSPLFAVLGIAIVLGVIWMARSARTTPVAIAFGLMIGGALGNLADRFFRRGAGVIDFIDVGRWPVFNLADSFLFMGAGLMILLSFRQGGRDG